MKSRAVAADLTCVAQALKAGDGDWDASLIAWGRLCPYGDLI